ncbi:MAG: hypothetical protein IJF84_11145 [Thermoguttaceae bacterium]|nr:hypothetical protein [Thermoguttaceae bacterium]
MFGPIFTRELAVSPERTKIYVARSIYAALFLAISATAWLLITGSQQIRDVGDFARFGIRLFSILAPLSLTLAMFQSALLSASSVSQEKDRKTLDLLLLTNLSSYELTVGKLASSLLHAFILPFATLPVLMSCTVFGGVDAQQTFRVFGVTLASSIVSGAIGSAIAFRCEKTFLTISLTLLTLTAWLIAGETAPYWTSVPACNVSPYSAVLAAAEPIQTQPQTNFYLFCALATILIYTPVILRVRIWNPPRIIKAPVVESTAENPVNIHAENLISRPVWDNPILWREVRTAAYGKRLFLYRLGYLVMAGLCLYAVLSQSQTASDCFFYIAPLALLSLVLINAQSVTAISTERDGKALDLLLSSDLLPSEFVWGKLLGAFWNSKEMVLVPPILVGVVWFFKSIPGEYALYLIIGYLILTLFSATLGLHCGMIYANSRQSIGVSLGVVFFLFVGVAVCLRMMLTFSGSFQAQFQPFLALIVGGGAGLYAALGIRNPSSAIALASFGCPCATFYALVALMMNYSLGVFFVVCVAYGFAVAAMLVPAIYEFDIVSSKAD